MKPYALLLGGSHPQALIELHDICFAMAKNHKDAFKQVAHSWFGDPESSHVDAWLDLSVVDGHQFTPGKNPSQKSLYFVNVGSYLTNVFSENHHYFFLICKDRNEAKKRAIKLAGKNAKHAHPDNLSMVDALIKIDKIQGKDLGWSVAKNVKKASVKTGYWPLQKFQ